MLKEFDFKDKEYEKVYHAILVDNGYEIDSGEEIEWYSEDMVLNNIKENIWIVINDEIETEDF